MPDTQRPPGDPSPNAGPRTLDPVLVTAEPDHIGRYAASMDLCSAVADRTSVLFTYPITWLLHPDIKDAVLKRAGRDRIPVHIRQEITCRRAVEAGCSYILAVTLADAEEPGPKRLLVTGDVSTMNGESVCSLAATLLIVSLTATDLALTDVP